MAPTSLTVTTANICGNPLRAKPVVRRRMRQALSQPGAVFGQEVARSNRWRGNGDYNSLWRIVARNHGKTTAGGAREVPISVPKNWEILSSASHLVHGGLKAVSPARYITDVRCRIDGRLVAFLNCHPVSKPRKGVSASAWRIARWNEYHAELASLVRALHNSGYTVVFGGDMNKRSVAAVTAGQHVAVESGLDHLWVFPAVGVSARVAHTDKIVRTVLMDHPILTATLELS